MSKGALSFLAAIALAVTPAASFAQDADNISARTLLAGTAMLLAKRIYYLDAARNVQYNDDVEGFTKKGWDDTSHYKNAVADAIEQFKDSESTEDIVKQGAEYLKDKLYLEDIYGLVDAVRRADDALAPVPHELDAIELAAQASTVPDAESKFNDNFTAIDQNTQRCLKLLMNAIRKFVPQEVLDSYFGGIDGPYLRYMFLPQGDKDVLMPFLPDIDISELTVRIPLLTSGWTSDFQPGDEITNVEGKEVKDQYDVLLAMVPKKDSYTFTVKRDGQTATVTVKVKPK